MARKKITLDNLGEELEKTLNDYGDDLVRSIDEVTKKVGQKGAAALRNESLEKFPASKKHEKRYGSTWKTKKEKTRLYSTITIYNSQPGFPHLLEKGHASRNGGRVPGKQHISGVEAELIREFTKEVESRI